MADQSPATRPSHVDEASGKRRGRGDVGGIGWQEIGIIVAIVIGIVIVVRLRA